MKKDTTGFSFAKVQSKSNSNGMPIAVAVIGASVVLMALMLLVNEKKSTGDSGNYEVENYDVVGNMPFIFGVGE